MKKVLLTIEIRTEPDVVLARQRARLLAELLEFDLQDQTRIATAVSEVARNAFQYGDRGRASFSLDDTEHGERFGIRISDRGPGITNVTEVLEGPYRSKTGMGIGLRGAKKLMDHFSLETSPSGTVVELAKNRPSRAGRRAPDLAKITARLAAQSADNAFEAVRQQNQELLRALEDLKAREEQLTHLNRELAETNTGVLALYAELEDRAAALRGASALKARFHSQMSHEVRTPINSILSISELLLNGTIAAPLPAQEKPLGFILKAARQLSELVNDHLDLARVEAGKMVVRREPLAITNLFGALRGMFRPLHRNDAVTLVFDDVSHLALLDSDEGKLHQILRNFISNALKFTERGEVRVSARDEGNDAVFEVSDTGIGISAGDQALLFRDFAQIENAKQKTLNGTGLGLALSRELAELLGGRVSVTSTEGEGSVFRLSIPRAIDSPHPAADEPAPDRGILIIDDDEAARFILRSALRGVPYGIAEAENGLDGLEKARAERPRLVFLDLNMPGIDGFEVLERLKADPETAAIPVVVNSSLSLSTTEREQLADRTVAILTKGISATDVSRRVAAVLRQAGLSGGQPIGEP